jgi:hypothetical protein
VEQQARIRLNMVRPGEMGLILLDHEARREVARDQADVPDNWYERLWSSVRSPGATRATEPPPGEGGETASNDAG